MNGFKNGLLKGFASLSSRIGLSQLAMSLERRRTDTVAPGKDLIPHVSDANPLSKSEAESRLDFLASEDFTFDPYHEAPKLSRLEQRINAARQPRCRKHKRPVKAPPAFHHYATHFEAFLAEAADYLPYRPSGPLIGTHGDAINNFSCGLDVARVAVGATVCLGLDAVNAVKNKVVETIEAPKRAAALEKRRTYYAAYNEKRRAEAALVASNVPAPLNPCPRPEELTEAYYRRHDSEEAKIRFGQLMIDLEENVRYRVETEGNKIVGTTGGVRDWLKANCPELAKHYHTCLRFKRKLQFVICEPWEKPT